MYYCSTQFIIDVRCKGVVILTFQSLGDGWKYIRVRLGVTAEMKDLANTGDRTLAYKTV